MRDRLIELIKQCDKTCADKYTGKVMLHINEIYNFIANYLLENGVIVPPYSIGSKVYAFISSLCLPIPNAIYECEIQRYVLTAHGLVAIVKLKKGSVTYGEIQKDISHLYETREEAEQALKGGEG